MNVIFECPTLLRNCLLSHEPPRQLTKNRILCFKFSLNPLRFSFARETDPAKSLKIWKTSILEWWTWPKQQFCCFFLFNCKSYHSRIEVLQNCTASFVSVSLVRENLRGFRENLRHKIRTIEAVMPIGAIFSRQYCTPGNGREEGVSEKKQHQFREKTSAHCYF